MRLHANRILQWRLANGALYWRRHGGQHMFWVPVDEAGWCQGAYEARYVSPLCQTRLSIEHRTNGRWYMGGTNPQTTRCRRCMTLMRRHNPPTVANTRTIAHTFHAYGPNVIRPVPPEIADQFRPPRRRRTATPEAVQQAPQM